MALSTSIVIVTYNGWPLLRDCLASLAEQTRQADEIIVVDNGSIDGTLEHLAQLYPRVTRVAAGRNLGFAAGNNLGISRATGDVIILINNDIVAEPRFVAELVAPLEADAGLGSVAGTMVFANAPDTVASAGIEVHTNGLALDRALGVQCCALTDSDEVFGPSAGAAAYSRAALEDAGLFHGPFFMYLEDVDLAWRLRLRGWRSVHASRAVVRHRYSASGIEGSPWKRRLLARNRLWLIVRCVPSSLLWRNMRQMLAYEVLAVGYALLHRDWAALRGRLEALAGLPARLRERRAIQRNMTASTEHLASWLRPGPAAREVVRLRRMTAELAQPNPGR